MRLAVLCASFNRVETTLVSLSGLWACLGSISGLEPVLFLLDDASPDGTAARVRMQFPTAVVIDGSGDLYWNRGMRQAYLAARQAGEWDAYLLFNDDTLVLPAGVRAAFEAYLEQNALTPTACVGSLTDLSGRTTTYGGFRRSGWLSPLSIEVIQMSGVACACDTFHGNFVLVPAKQMDAADPFPAVYHHSYGDIDLGYRLRRDGVRLFVSAQPVGRADRNAPADHSTITKRYKSMLGKPNGLGQLAFFYRRTVPFPLWVAVAILGLTMRVKRVVLR
jgi:GT2 family glycosyltransferase